MISGCDDNLSSRLPFGRANTAADLARGIADARSSQSELSAEVLGALFNVAAQWAERRLHSWPDARDDALDVAQEVVTRLCSHLDQCRARSDGEVVNWTIAIARHVVADLVRSPSFQNERLLRTSAEATTRALEVVSFSAWRQQESVGAADDSSALDATGCGHASGGPSAARELIYDAMLCALEGLPPTTRHIVWLHLVESMRWKCVSEQIGIPATAAKRRYQRAIAALRRSVLGHLARLSVNRRVIAASGLGASCLATNSPRHLAGKCGPLSPDHGRGK
jgi:RNA polymerase sigma factor, sigma-70 family